MSLKEQKSFCELPRDWFPVFANARRPIQSMVTAFSRELGWKSFELLVTQFQDRLQFGIQSDLLDLMRLQTLNGSRARALFNAGIESVCELASADALVVENALLLTVPFQSEKERDGEVKYDVDKRNNMKCLWITGRKGVTTKEAAELLIYEARHYLQMEMGIADIKWKSDNNGIKNSTKIDASALPSQLNSSNIFTQKIETPVKVVTSVKGAHVSQCLLASKNNSPEHSTPKNFSDIEKKICENISQSSELNFSTEFSPFDGEKSEVITNNALPIQKVNLSLTQNCSMESVKVTDERLGFTELLKDCFKSDENVSMELHDTSKKSNSIFQSDLSKSMFDDSFTVDTQLCEKLDKKEVNIQVSVANDEDEKKNALYCSTYRDTDGLSCVAEAFDSSFSSSVKLSFKSISNEIIDCSSESKNVIDRSQEGSAFISRSVNRVKRKTLKKKMLKKNITCGKRKLTDTANENDHFEIYNNPSPFKQIKLQNRTNINIPVYRSTYKDDCITVDLSIHLLPNHSNNKLNHIKNNYKMLKIVDACKNSSTFNECTSFLLSINKFSIYMQTAISKTTGDKKIGVVTVSNKDISDVVNNTYKRKYIEGISIYTGDELIYYFNFQIHDSTLTIAEVLEFFKALFTKNKLAVMYNCKKSFILLKKSYGIDIKCFWEDPLVGEWLLNPESDPKSLESMAADYCGCDVNISTKANDSVYSVAGLRAWSTWHVMDYSKHCLIEKSVTMLETLSAEMDALKVLAECEICGIRVNKDTAAKILNQVRSAQNILETNAFKITGRRFRLSSPSEVSKVLGMHRSRKGSTNKKALEKIENPLAQLIIYWRKLNSILTKNLFPLTAQAVQNADNQRIHGSYLTHTSTGRMTMQEPNLQCVPRNFEIPAALLAGHPDAEDCSVFRCRNIFPSTAGTLLVSADYCQLELRLLAHLSEDSTLRKIVTGNGDIFKSIAATWKSIPEIRVDDDLRQKAKQICYGIIYGMGSKALAQTLNVCELEANVFINTFHSAYPSIKLFINSVIKNCQKSGYIETLSGRRRYLSSINSGNISERAHAERQAVNTTIQGSAADILKSAMRLVHQKLEDDLQINLVLLLHDELIYEVPVENVDYFTCLLKHCMESTVSLSVPLPVKVKCGKLWGDLEEIHLDEIFLAR